MLTFAMMFTPVFLCFLAVKYMQYAEYLLQYCILNMGIATLGYLWTYCIHYPVYMDLMISEIRMNFTRTFQKLLLHTFSHPGVPHLFTPFTIYIQVHTRMYINTAALHCTLKNLNKHFKNFLKISLYFKFSAKTMVESGAGKHNSDPGATDTQHWTLNLVFSLFAFG